MTRRPPPALALFVAAFALTTLAILGGGGTHRPALAAAERHW